MMTRTEYKNWRLEDMKAKRWRTTCAIRSGVAVIPKGAEVKIVGKRGGVDIQLPTCKCCGVAVLALKVYFWRVEEIKT